MYIHTLDAQETVDVETEVGLGDVDVDTEDGFEYELCLCHFRCSHDLFRLLLLFTC